ncbi:hypothetical protein ACTHGU_04025 [Chitinophagaceae bacterium MMS25-I14]
MMKKQARINSYKKKQQIQTAAQTQGQTQNGSQAPAHEHPEIYIDRGDMDIRLFDLVLKMLYENSDKSTLHLENEILKPFNINLPPKENERIWDVLLSSGFVSPVVGFGNAGKIELTKTGYQIMSQYGAYSKFLEMSAAAGQQRQPIIIQMDQNKTGEQKQSDVLPNKPNLDGGLAG